MVKSLEVGCEGMKEGLEFWLGVVWCVARMKRMCGAINRIELCWELTGVVHVQTNLFYGLFVAMNKSIA